MKNIIASIIVSLVAAGLCLAQTQADSLAWSHAEWNWTDLGKGASAGYCQCHIFDSIQSISVVKYPASKFRTRIIHAPAELSNSTDSLAKRESARFAINGSYFDMEKMFPHAFLSYRHKIVATSPATETYRSNGVLLMRGRNGRGMAIVPYDSTATEWYSRHYYAALASGPILQLDGKTPDFNNGRSFYAKRHPRSFIGWDKGGYVYLVVVDGRFPGEGEGATIAELAILARLLGLENALNLDGGGSATLWTDKTDIINHPCDNQKFDREGARRVPNAIIVK